MQISHCANELEEYFNIRGEVIYHHDNDYYSRVRDTLKKKFDTIHIPVFHIAGTNGKTSTSYFLSQMISHTFNNKKIGLFTSPHILSFNERISINDSCIDNRDINTIFKEVKDIIVELDAGYFLSSLIVAMLYFIKNNVDYIVIESGIGGNHDSTNMLEYSSRVGIITSIGLDHMQLLGESKESILKNKIGICKGNKMNFIGYNDNKLLLLAKHIVPSINILNCLEYKNEYPEPFDKNFSLASFVFEKYFNQKPNNTSYKLPKARFTKIDRFIIDGAHNEDALQSIVDKLIADNESIETIITSATKERDISKHYHILNKLCDNIMIVKLDGFELLIPDNLMKYLADGTVQAISKSKGKTLITGSLYLCAEAIKFFGDK